MRVREPVSTVLEMTEIQTRLLAENGPAVIFEQPVKADGSRSDIPVLVNLFGTVKRVAMGVTMGGVERRDAKSLARGGRASRLAPPARAAAQHRGSVRAPAARQERAVDEAQDGRREKRALPADRASGRRHRSQSPAGPDLLAGRARAADHLAARRDQGAIGLARGQFQSRHLPHAAAVAEPDDHALAAPSRRRAAASPLVGEERGRAVPRRGRDRRRSGHRHRRGHAGARHVLGVSVRRSVARRARRAHRLRHAAAEGARPKPRS